MTWMILICSLPDRHEKLKRLTSILDKQLVEGVSYKIHDAGPSMPTGRKRNQLIEQSRSEYFSFCDDDDIISDEYVSSIMRAIKHNPDVITFNGYMTTNGTDRRNFTIKLGSEYVERNGHYYRFPNHLAVFKRSKVEMVKFPELWQQEDFKWASKIHERKLLTTEVHIDKDLYWYDYISKTPRHRRR